MISLRRFLLSVSFLGILVLPAWASAQRVVPVYFFWGDGCPHCEDEWELLRSIEDRYAMAVHDFEIWNNRDNARLLGSVAEVLGARVRGVPFTVIGDEVFMGFSPRQTGPAIVARIEQCLESACPDSVGPIVRNAEAEMEEPAPVEHATPRSDGETAPLILSLPLVGEMNVSQYSLPVLTIIIAALDGFNPCAMWTLLFLLSLLIGMESRVRRWTLGIAFLVASASVYFLFLAAWLHLILFLGFLAWIRIGIGIVALGGGTYYLKEYFRNKDGTCKVTGGERRQRVFQKIRDIIHERSFWLALIGIVVLAFAVNLVELICSAGLPAVYTQVLALNALPSWQYYAYLLLYMFVFLLDDLFVFFAAMLTLELTGVTSKYARLSHLIGGLVMLAIGLLLIFKPSVLMFG